MMKIYSYHPETGHYISESIADESPLEPGSYLIPAWATDVAPPATQDGMVAVFSAGAWSLVSGDAPIEADSLLTPSQLLARHKANKAAELKIAAGVVIVSGIAFEALGYVCTYPTTRDDQVNLNGLVTESLLPGSGDIYKFWCADGGGVWARRIHTKLQIQELGKAVADHVKTQQEKYEQKLTEIASSDESGLAAVVW